MEWKNIITSTLCAGIFMSIGFYTEGKMYPLGDVRWLYLAGLMTIALIFIHRKDIVSLFLKRKSRKSPSRAIFASSKLHRLWPEMAGLEAQLEMAIEMESDGQLRHCEKHFAYMLPKLERLKIYPGRPLEITQENAEHWRDYFFKLSVAAENKQIKEARLLKYSETE